MGVRCNRDVGGSSPPRSVFSRTFPSELRVKDTSLARSRFVCFRAKRFESSPKRFSDNFLVKKYLRMSIRCAFFYAANLPAKIRIVYRFCFVEKGCCYYVI